MVTRPITVSCVHDSKAHAFQWNEPAVLEESTCIITCFGLAAAYSLWSWLCYTSPESANAAQRTAADSDMLLQLWRIYSYIMPLKNTVMC